MSLQFIRCLRTRRPLRPSVRPQNSASSAIETTAQQHVDTSPLTSILGHPAIVIGRQLEMLNVFMGYEQANKYQISCASTGSVLGYIAEEQSLMKSITRQFLRTHRPFQATVMNTNGDVVLRVHRPFQWINSRLYVEDDQGRNIGEVKQQWHLIRRKYNLFLEYKQFAHIDVPFLSWDFVMTDEKNDPMASVSKNFSGFARELFTDSSNYILRLAPEDSTRVLSIPERAVALACAISIDFDYFSRHSGGGGLLGWLPFYGYSEPLPSEGSTNDLPVPTSADAGVTGGASGVAGGIGTSIPVMMPPDLFGDKSPGSPVSNNAPGESTPPSGSESGPFLSDEEAGLDNDTSRDGFLEDSESEGGSVFGQIMDIFGNDD